MLTEIEVISVCVLSANSEKKKLVAETQYVLLVGKFSNTTK